MARSANEADPAYLASDTEASKARLRLWLRMLKSTRRVEAALRERLRREFDSTLPRFDVMAALARYDRGLKMSTLSGVLRVSNGNVTGIDPQFALNGGKQRGGFAFCGLQRHGGGKGADLFGHARQQVGNGVQIPFGKQL